MKYNKIVIALQIVMAMHLTGLAKAGPADIEKLRVFNAACERLLVQGEISNPKVNREEILSSGAKFSEYFKAVNENVLERGYLVRLAEISLISQEHLLMVGPPGNAKSLLADLTYGNIVDHEAKPSYFKDQMTAETTLSDTHGYVDFSVMDKEGRVERRYQDGVLGSRLAFLDEIFDIGPKALRNILGTLAERSHKNHKGKTWSVISATNHYISEVYAKFNGGKEPQAVLDRFAMAAYVPADFESAGSYRKLIRGVKSSFAKQAEMPKLTFEDIEKLQAMLPEVQIPDHVADFLSFMVYRLRPEVEAQEESSRRDHDEKIRSGESALPSWRSTKLMSLRTLGKAVNVLKSIIVLNWMESGGKRALIANLEDIKGLEIFFSLNGPSDKFVETELERSTDPHERSQLETIIKERQFFRELYHDLSKEFNETVSGYPLTEIAQGVQSFENMTPKEQTEFLGKLRELYFVAEAQRVTDNLSEQEVTTKHIAHTALFESVHEWLVMLKGEKEAKAIIDGWEKDFTETDKKVLKDKLNIKPKEEPAKTEAQESQDKAEDIKSSDKNNVGLFIGLAKKSKIDPKIIKNASQKSFDYAGVKKQAFTMGSPSSEAGRFDNEAQKPVTLTKAFEVQATPVTQLQWSLVMGSNPSKFSGAEYAEGDHVTVNGIEMNANHPVEQVSWDEAQEYVKKMNAQNDGYEYSLLTEAQWEVAARAGTTTAYAGGDGEQVLAASGWYSGNANSRTHAVAQKTPNALGLYDMHGNVWEWVQDYWGDKLSGGTDPTGPSAGSDRVLRGGSWYSDAQHCRSAVRYYGQPGSRSGNVGVRLMRTRKP